MDEEVGGPGAADSSFLIGRELTSAWNPMVTKPAGIVLTKSLAFGGIHGYWDYFRRDYFKNKIRL